MKKTSLKRTKGINPKSSKQIEKDRAWNAITDELCLGLNYICQWCGKSGHRRYFGDPSYLDGHHIVKRSQVGQDIKSNAYLCHRICHSEITDKGINVGEYPTKIAWKERKT